MRGRIITFTLNMVQQICGDIFPFCIVLPTCWPLFYRMFSMHLDFGLQRLNISKFEITLSFTNIALDKNLGCWGPQELASFLHLSCSCIHSTPQFISRLASQFRFCVSCLCHLCWKYLTILKLPPEVALKDLLEICSWPYCLNAMSKYCEFSCQPFSTRLVLQMPRNFWLWEM